MNDNEIIYCKYCKKDYNHSSSYRKHKTRKEHILQVQYYELENKYTKMEKKVKILEKELQNKTTIQNQINNNKVINNQIININNNYNINFTLPGKERIDHITDAQLREMLNEKNFDIFLKQLISTVFFHPSVPENTKWCVSDKEKFGAIEYNPEKNCLVRKDTEQVINMNVQNIIDPIIDRIEIMTKKGDLNKIQKINYHNMIRLFGTELSKDSVNNVKEDVFKNRRSTQVLWEKLGLMITEQYKTK